MPIEISKTLVKKLPVEEQGNVEKALWDKSGGVCWLCEEPLNRSSDDIHTDHDVPESEGGATTLANLNLAHSACNKAKRNAKTVPIRPYLKLVAFSKKNGGRLKYDGFLKHFDIAPQEIVLSRNGDSASFELPDGTKRTVPIYSESNGTGVHEYVFLPLPRNAIFNDDACQPRVVRTDHAWSIYSDMQRNVLHEPPSCRLEEYRLDQPIRLLLFDGQHKTIASWMMGREEVASKVYLNMNAAKANELVNSIQAKIKKLPLSPFELAGKMADEWENKFSEYEVAVGANEVSEDGFIKWLPQTDRARGKSALQSALIQNLLTSPDLRITSHVKSAGGAGQPFGFTEQQLKSKVLERLLSKDPLALKGEAAQRARDIEATNIVTLLNRLNDLAFEPSADDGTLGPTELERARRMCYQSSLAYISSLIRQMWVRVSLAANPKDPMSSEVNENQDAELADAMRLIVEHPVWTAAFNRDEKMAAVKVALEKNQEAAPAFAGVGFDFAYVVLGKQAPTYIQYWG
ncbi:HNH endonuclease [Arthrobacter zhaoguopingii]|uniref:HNH endonuclease n=1 Tax=Arthrobacter zhaoguopingii TaxID=2681491 RepID=UPI00135C23ED|nr:HNH endonuclease signature motif containing protein [Arthrobacter zhaoguopingii]